MKVKVKITGLECPNCARALQTQLGKLPEVQNCEIDFMKSTLVFESDTPKQALEKILRLTARLEPDAKIIADKKLLESHTSSTKVSPQHKSTDVACCCCEGEIQKGNSSTKNTNSATSAKNKHFKKVALDVFTLGFGIALAIFIFFFPLPAWAYWTLYALSALLLGWKTYYKAAKLLLRGVINENLLITISVVGASIISEHMEGLMVIALYSIGKIFEGLAVQRSRASIEKLVRMHPEYANLLQNGKQVRVAPEEVAIGSTILVHAGEKVPLDGIVEKGQCLVDNQSLTGESVPVKKQAGEQILSGGIVLDGTLQICTTSAYKDSAIAKIMDLVENASENKSKTETFISRLTRWYTLGVVLCAVLVWGIVWAATGVLETAFYRGLIFLVVSCPCAFAISVPLSYFAGLGNASKNGVLIKGSNFLDACAGLKMVAFDKTGTLTTGNFEIVSIIAQKGFEKTQILHLAALGEKNSLHPIAKAICTAWENEEKAHNENFSKNEIVENFKEIAGQGVEFNLGKDVFFVGRKSENLKATTVEVFKNNALIGKIELSDTIKAQSFDAVRDLQHLGVKSALLSGDNEEVARAVGQKLGIAEVKSALLPQQKFEYLQNCKQQKMRVGYVGDGINDAPSLAVADVGFSMGINGAPASIEASDVVIVDDNPQKIVTAIKLSRFTRKIVWENIILSALIKITFLALGAAGITGMLAAVFADVGVTLLAVLNSLRALHHKA